MVKEGISTFPFKIMMGELTLLKNKNKKSVGRGKIVR